MASSGKMKGPSAPALRRDPYEVLSVPRDSSNQEIKSAYRKLALKCSWAKLLWTSLREATGIKLPLLHPNSWASDMITVKATSDKDSCLLLCGSEPNATAKHQNNVSWMPPIEDAVKINVDASFNPNPGQGATGCLILDSYGNLIQARARWFQAASDALNMEANAFREGVKLAADLRKQWVMVESDCQVLVNLWHSSDVMTDRRLPLL